MVFLNCYQHTEHFRPQLSCSFFYIFCTTVLVWIRCTDSIFLCFLHLKVQACVIRSPVNWKLQHAYRKVVLLAVTVWPVTLRRTSVTECALVRGSEWERDNVCYIMRFLFFIWTTNLNSTFSTFAACPSGKMADGSEACIEWVKWLNNILWEKLRASVNMTWVRREPGYQWNRKMNQSSCLSVVHSVNLVLTAMNVSIQHMFDSKKAKNNNKTIT